ncbi:DUF4269 domain-containing protein [Paenibacillus marinisediminis]
MLDITFFRDLSYLKRGTDQQQDAYRVLTSYRILEPLIQVDPVLVGTVPLALNIPGSDLDIVCEVHDPDVFAEDVGSMYAGFDDYETEIGSTRGIPFVCIRFTCEGWPIEIFGQPVPVSQQNGYRHMVAEYRILQLIGPAGKERLLRHKLNGEKTEPAFAQYLQLSGDPYEAMLELADADDAALRALTDALEI